jgi:putative SOS response-associated peptidase YedK
MCNLYSITRSQEAMRRLFRVNRDLLGNFPGLPAVFPGTLAPVVHTALDGERETSFMRWGFPPPPNLGAVPVTNVRNLKSPYWRGCSSQNGAVSFRQRHFANGPTAARK